jgi:hypothetical protein
MVIVAARNEWASTYSAMRLSDGVSSGIDLAIRSAIVPENGWGTRLGGLGDMEMNDVKEIPTIRRTTRWNNSYMKKFSKEINLHRPEPPEKSFNRLKMNGKYASFRCVARFFCTLVVRAGHASAWRDTGRRDAHARFDDSCATEAGKSKARDSPADFS